MGQRQFPVLWMQHLKAQHSLPLNEQVLMQGSGMSIPDLIIRPQDTLFMMIVTTCYCIYLGYGTLLTPKSAHLKSED